MQKKNVFNKLLAYWGQSSENTTGLLTMKMQLKPFPIQMGCDVDVYAL